MRAAPFPLVLSGPAIRRAPGPHLDIGDRTRVFGGARDGNPWRLRPAAQVERAAPFT